MMRIVISLLLLLLFGLSPVFAAAAGDQHPGPEGLWLTKKKDSAIRIERCGKSLCGYIAWLRPDVEQVTPKGEPLCGQKVLWGFKQSSSEPALWEDGHIYKADDDKKYAGWIRIKKDGRLKLRGYVFLPFLGKSYVFTRTTPQKYPPCSK
jgi:uncharacterized protein (DUF2147 family)